MKGLLTTQAVSLASVKGQTSTINGIELNLVPDRNLQKLSGGCSRKFLTATQRNLSFACLILSLCSVLSNSTTDSGPRNNRHIRLNFRLRWMISLVVHGLFLFFLTLFRMILAEQSWHIFSNKYHKTIVLSCVIKPPQCI